MSSTVAGYWALGLKPDAQIRGLREQVVELLAGLERKELDRFHASTPHRIYRPVGTLRELGVRSGTAYLTSEPSVVIFTHGPGGETAIGHLAGSNATKAAVREAQKSDNIRKLGAANRDEAHLFVFIHYMEAAITALTFRSPPDDKPDLPTEITHLWVAGTTSSTDTYRVWRGSQDGVWTDLGEVPV